MLDIRQLDAFYGDAQALWGVTLDVGAGETVSLIGPNGAGKSTLVASVAGLHASVRGHIDIGGVDIVGLPAHRVCARGVAVVPEGRRIFGDMSVYDNLCLGAYRRAARARYRQILTEVFELFPRLSARSTQLAGSLSGGEQQMLAIGRALMTGPSLLLLDEPSLGLAPIVVDEVFEAITTINRSGVSVLLVEQDIDRALEISTRGYLLAEGRIIASAPSDRLRDNEDVQRNILGV
ncbi:MAG: ATP-binding cassette domain-containing protein [Actinophytocola sp.]|uniref:ABC transporter ATP-binding protein n=1 Tax=Actinophytocola sp. TaxID=1872138 RepID=UPI00132B2AE7|nr:ABC transporter ATP-binding protein [Actinophytocola sp.]MPZ79755.1 ATP-binding cassette domain-containing protein [Actinophytocola sp.]